MRKVKFFSTFILLTLLLSTWSGVVQAQEPPPGSPRSFDLPGLDRPVSEWADAELEKLVGLILEEQITISQSEAIAKQLTKEQIKRIGELLAVRVGVPLDEWRQLELREETTAQSSSRGMLWGLWPIEHYYNLSWARHADYYYSSSECGSNDDDWVFYYYLYYAQDPDGLRWRTDSSRVYWAFIGWPWAHEKRP